MRRRMGVNARQFYSSIRFNCEIGSTFNGFLWYTRFAEITPLQSRRDDVGRRRT